MIPVCIVLFAAVLAPTSAVEVSTGLGIIRGVTLKTRLGADFHAFRGIRYAKSPEGELRFESPQPVDPWKPKVFDATADGPMCPQAPFNSTFYAEDCLRLNVYSKNLDPNAKKPVIIYIHPGGFYVYSGQSNTFAGPQPIMDRDIVLVTINYRLGTLGFLATGTRESPGNAGLKDQVVAFKWVKDHIRKFGGDPDSITLMGYSAGSLSINLHLASPMTRGLFHRAIAMSASAVTQTPYPMEQLDLAKKQAELVNCPTDTVEVMIRCFKKTPVDEFVRTMFDMFEFDFYPTLNWKPVVEKDFGQERFITEDITKSFQAGRFQRVPLIIGMTKDEFVQLAYNILINETQTQQLNEDWDRLVPIYFQYERNTPRSKEISAVFRKKYLDNKPLVANGPIEPLGKLFKDGIIGFGVHRFAHLAARYVPVYYYHFSYQGRFSNFMLPDNKPYGTVHHDDLVYLLNNTYVAPLFTKSDPEDKTVERLSRMWTQFAKTGDPNNPDDEYTKNVHWQPLDLKKENYLDIGEELVSKERLYLQRFSIWNKLFPLNWSGISCKRNKENLDYPEGEESEEFERLI